MNVTQESKVLELFLVAMAICLKKLGTVEGMDGGRLWEVYGTVTHFQKQSRSKEFPSMYCLLFLKLFPGKTSVEILSFRLGSL